MKKGNSIAAVTVLVLVVLVVGGGLFLFSRQNSSVVMEDKIIEESTDKTSRYIPYSQTVLEESKGSRRVLFFYANWCPTCIPADANFKQNLNKIPEDVVLIRVNYNDTETDEMEKELAKKYGITYQHTFVQIDSEGNEITKWNGGQIDELLANIK